MDEKIEQFPQFTPEAKKLWMNVPAEIRTRLLANVFCGDCGGETKSSTMRA